MAQPDKIGVLSNESTRRVYTSIMVEWVDKFNTFLRMFQVLGTFVEFSYCCCDVLGDEYVHLLIYNRRNELEIANCWCNSIFIMLPFLLREPLGGYRCVGSSL